MTKRGKWLPPIGSTVKITTFVWRHTNHAYGIVVEWHGYNQVTVKSLHDNSLRIIDSFGCRPIKSAGKL